MANQPIEFKISNYRVFENSLTPTKKEVSIPNSILKAVHKLFDIGINGISLLPKYSQNVDPDKPLDFDNSFLNIDLKRLQWKFNKLSKNNNGDTKEIQTLTHGDITACLCYFFYDFLEIEPEYQRHTKKNLEEFFSSLEFYKTGNKFDKHLGKINLFLKHLKKDTISEITNIQIRVNGYKVEPVFDSIESNGFIPKFQSNGSTSKKFNKNTVNYDQIKFFMSVGDYVSAINFFQSGQDFFDLPTKTQIKILEIQQKYGLLDECKCLLSKLRNTDLTRISSEQDGLLKLIELKLSSQLQDFNNVIDLFEPVKIKLEATPSSVRLCSANLRVAYAYACINNKNLSLDHLHQAKKIVNQHKEFHLKNIVLLYEIMLYYFLDIGEIQNPFKSIEDCQYTFFEYVTNNSEEIRYQTNLIQVVNQCLFIEIAMYIDNGEKDKAEIRLVLANLLAHKARCKPESEGYAELLSLLPNNSLKKNILNAMDSTDEGRLAFQKNIQPVATYLRKLQKTIVPFYYSPTLENWKQIRNILSEFDGR